ncbi:class I SAM-dependent methyltransferase [Halococcus thailandensis]|uniref:Methyltransferase type 11 n=1 Tax=Halococcus thailandensis JCM 13552 TaxID=1227457 RepID=M0N894_9EURY|nr:class I SAM-dependent methyltransferase [Halococcus thailandensis]EMA54172.1 Methyltransferase type 11 [Halococcus thailandensis JCM 13552]
MGHHTFDADRADKLEDAGRRYRYVSGEELLWALAPDSSDTVADLGSGTGFFTDVVAPHADTVYAIDVQEAMHDHYAEKGLPDTVEPVTTGIEELPFEDGSIDGAFSTMTYHEFASDDALGELRRVLTGSGRLAIVDWSGEGLGERGPPLDERYTVETASGSLREHGFTIEHTFTRPETFLLIAVVE